MQNNNRKGLGNVIRIDESEIHNHLGELVRGTVEDTLNKATRLLWPRDESFADAVMLHLSPGGWIELR